MHVHVLQHVPFEGIGVMARWFAEQEANVSYTRLYDETDTFPPLAGIDLIVALGGPMSVNDEATLPWLVTEKRFIRDAIDAGIPTLGICLGAQLIASCLGARVQRNSHQEIGWFPIQRCSTQADHFEFPERATVFHWHNETFDIPPGAVRLAQSAACENQAFQIGRHVIGLQCHPEMTQRHVGCLLGRFAHELVPQAYVQSAETLANMPAEQYEPGHTLILRILSYLVAARHH